MAWNVTAVDYDTALYTNAEARLGAGVTASLWAKWLHRDFFDPSRSVKSGRGGQYAARKIFEIRVMNLATTDLAIPPSEAKQIAELAAKGSWNPVELKSPVELKKNWRSYVIRANAEPLDMFLLFSRTKVYRGKNCWGYEPTVGPPQAADLEKNSVLLVLAAARELIAVSKYCWNILEESGRTG
jgi:hypothetical protein